MSCFEGLIIDPRASLLVDPGPFGLFDVVSATLAAVLDGDLRGYSARCCMIMSTLTLIYRGKGCGVY